MAQSPIIDTHVHLYDPKDQILQWVADVPKLNKPHLIEDYRAATQGLEIEAMVFVEVDAAAGKNIKEIEWLSAYAKSDPRIRAMVASFPLELGAACQAHIEAYAANPLARGVRRLIQGHVNEPGWCLEPKFIEGVKLLARHDLNFDICIKHPQMGDAIELAERCPNVRFVLDHIGKPAIAAGYREPWARQIRKLARLPNVWCKISGVVTEADHEAWTPEQVAPYIKDVINAFGFNRVMYGSDWPVLNLASNYQRWVELLREILVSASDTEQERFWNGTAREVYRL